MTEAEITERSRVLRLSLMGLDGHEATALLLSALRLTIADAPSGQRAKVKAAAVNAIRDI